MFGLKRWLKRQLIEEKRELLSKTILWLNEHDDSMNYPELNRWDDSKGDDQKWMKVHEIVVETEEDKRQLLAASSYIHDLMELDTSYMAVNWLAHLYTDPTKIVVRPKVDGHS